MKKKPLIRSGLFALLMISAVSQTAVIAQQPLARVMVSVTMTVHFNGECDYDCERDSDCECGYDGECD